MTTLYFQLRGTNGLLDKRFQGGTLVSLSKSGKEINIRKILHKNTTRTLIKARNYCMQLLLKNVYFPVGILQYFLLACSFDLVQTSRTFRRRCIKLPESCWNTLNSANITGKFCWHMAFPFILGIVCESASLFLDWHKSKHSQLFILHDKVCGILPLYYLKSKREKSKILMVQHSNLGKTLSN